MDKKIYARLRKISKRLKKEYRAQKVILFGSYANDCRQTEGYQKDHFPHLCLILA